MRNNQIEYKINQDILTSGDLNIYICGDINDNKNYDILKKIFPIQDTSKNGYIKLEDNNQSYYRLGKYLYEFRQKDCNNKELNGNNKRRIFNAFLFTNNKVNEIFSNVLIFHLYEKDKQNKGNNIIIQFGPVNNIKKSINKLSKFSDESIPLVIYVNDKIKDNNIKLDYTNYIPSLLSNEKLKNYIESKLYRMCAYYNEMGYNLNMINPLNEINLRIKFHLTIALVGYSGCGKSTFLNLVFKELVSKANSSSTDVTTKCSEYYLPIQNINNEIDNLGQIRFLDFPGITKEDNYQKIVEPSIINKVKEYKNNLEQIDVALFFIPNGVEREFNESGKKLVNLLYKNKIKIIFIINGKIKDFLLKKKKLRLRNLINNDNILMNDFSNLLSTNFFKYIDNKSNDGISRIFQKIYDFNQINIKNFNVENINVDNYNQQLALLKDNCRAFELFKNMNVLKKSAKIKSELVVLGYSLLSLGTAGLSIIVPVVDSFIVIVYQVAMVFNIMYIYDYNPHNYDIVNIILSGGKNIQELISNSLFTLAGKAAIKEAVKESAKEVGQTVVVKGTEKAIENVAIKTTQTVVKKTAEKAIIQASKEIAEESITQGTKVLTKEILKQSAKLGAVTASKEGIEEVAIEGSKQTIKHITEEVVIKNGGKAWLVNLGKAVPFIGVGVFSILYAYHTSVLGNNLISNFDNQFENNRQRNVDILRGRALSLQNALSQIQSIIDDNEMN